MPVSKFPTSPPSKAPPALTSSKFPAAGGKGDDSGPLVLMDGRLYYRQLADLAIEICVGDTISDVDWREFLEGSMRIARRLGRMPKVGIATFTDTYPNAKQRRETTSFLHDQGVKPIVRLGLLSDSALVRGAVVAFGWVVPDASARAFGSQEVVDCLAWLREVGAFDEKRAATVWNEACAELKLR